MTRESLKDWVLGVAELTCAALIASSFVIVIMACVITDSSEQRTFCRRSCELVYSTATYWDANVCLCESGKIVTRSGDKK